MYPARSLGLVVFAALLAGRVPAQGAGDGPGPDARVQVTLKNDAVIIGIARGSVLSERSTRRGFEPCAEGTDRKSGIRVWYYQKLDGFIFLPQTTLKDVKVLGTLSAVESKTLLDAIARTTASRAAIDRAGARPAPEPGTGPAAPPEADADPARAGGGLTDAERKLLSEFPPDKGWGPERFGEIQRRRIVLDIQPSAQERRFVEVYSEWETAFARSLKAIGDAAPGDAGGRTTPPKTAGPAGG